MCAYGGGDVLGGTAVGDGLDDGLGGACPLSMNSFRHGIDQGQNVVPTPLGDQIRRATIAKQRVRVL